MKTIITLAVALFVLGCSNFDGENNLNPALVLNNETQDTLYVHTSTMFLGDSSSALYLDSIYNPNKLVYGNSFLLGNADGSTKNFLIAKFNGHLLDSTTDSVVLTFNRSALLPTYSDIGNVRLNVYAVNISEDSIFALGGKAFDSTLINVLDTLVSSSGYSSEIIEFSIAKTDTLFNYINKSTDSSYILAFKLSDSIQYFHLSAKVKPYLNVYTHITDTILDTTIVNDNSDTTKTYFPVYNNVALASVDSFESVILDSSIVSVYYEIEDTLINADTSYSLLNGAYDSLSIVVEFDTSIITLNSSVVFLGGDIQKTFLVEDSSNIVIDTLELKNAIYTSIYLANLDTINLDLVNSKLYELNIDSFFILSASSKLLAVVESDTSFLLVTEKEGVVVVKKEIETATSFKNYVYSLVEDSVILSDNPQLFVSSLTGNRTRISLKPDSIFAGIDYRTSASELRSSDDTIKINAALSVNVRSAKLVVSLDSAKVDFSSFIEASNAQSKVWDTLTVWLNVLETNNVSSIDTFSVAVPYPSGTSALELNKFLANKKISFDFNKILSRQTLVSTRMDALNFEIWITPEQQFARILIKPEFHFEIRYTEK